MGHNIWCKPYKGNLMDPGAFRIQSTFLLFFLLSKDNKVNVYILVLQNINPNGNPGRAKVYVCSVFV